MVKSKVLVALQKIKKILIDVYLKLKLNVWAKTARKKKTEGAKGKTVVQNTKKAKVRNLIDGGEVKAINKPKRKFNGKTKSNQAVARGCGAILANKRKITKGAVTQS